MLTEYNPSDPTMVANPYPVLQSLQDEDPVHWSEDLRSWVLTRYDDVRAALNDPRLSADRITPFLDHLPPDERAAIAEVGAMLGRWAVLPGARPLPAGASPARARRIFSAASSR